MLGAITVLDDRQNSMTKRMTIVKSKTYAGKHCGLLGCLEKSHRSSHATLQSTRKMKCGHQFTDQSAVRSTEFYN